MQIKLGEKIRELRRRDGRTQETLAEALGITGQAISRWESGGSYPDMEMIPAIANYFHVTIDDLFGYDNDRTQRIRQLRNRAEAMFNAQGDMTECVALLRDAVAEFPAETTLWMQLGFALFTLGWQVHGARVETVEDSDYIVNDIPHNAQNTCWREAVGIQERVLADGISGEDRVAVICQLVQLYGMMGEYDKAEALADKQDSMIISREILLADASEGERQDRFQGEALLELARQVKLKMIEAVLTKRSLWRQGGIAKLLSAAHLYEAICDDGNCGFGHSDLRDLYLFCALLAARAEDLDQAMAHFAVGFHHHTRYLAIRDTGTYGYTAPLVSKVTFPSGNWPVVPEGSWTAWLQSAPDALVAAIRTDGRYAVCFSGEGDF